MMEIEKEMHKKKEKEILSKILHLLYKEKLLTIEEEQRAQELLHSKE